MILRVLLLILQGRSLGLDLVPVDTAADGYSVAQLATVQRVAADVALVVVAVDLRSAAGQAAGAIVLIAREDDRAGVVLLLGKRRRCAVQIAAGPAVQRVARRTLPAGHHHAVQLAGIPGVVVEASARTIVRGGRVQRLGCIAVNHVCAGGEVVAVSTGLAVVVAACKSVRANTDPDTAVTGTGTCTTLLVHQIRRTHDHTDVTLARTFARDPVPQLGFVADVLVQRQSYGRYHPSVLVTIRVDLDLYHVCRLLLMVMMMMMMMIVIITMLLLLVLQLLLVLRGLNRLHAALLAVAVRGLHFRDSSPTGCRGIDARSGQSDKYRCSGPCAQRSRGGTRNSPD